MENHIIISMLIGILILLIGLSISFIIFIDDYFIFKKRIERILDSNIKTSNHLKEVINLDSEINKGVKDVCNLNDRLIKKLIFLADENNDLRKIILSDNKDNEK